MSSEGLWASIQAVLGVLHTLTCLASQTSSSYTRTLRLRSSSMGPYSTWMYLQARQIPSQHKPTEQGDESMGRHI